MAFVHASNVEEGEMRGKFKTFAVAWLVLVFAVTSTAPAFADPPDWAPAWGYRAKHEDHEDEDEHRHRHHHHEHYIVEHERPVYAVPYGIDVGRCNRDLLGAAIGGAAGGLIGSNVGKGSGRTAAIVGGAIVGLLVGGSIGRAMDKVDQSCVGQVLEYARPNQTVVWQNPDNSSYQVTPVRTYERSPGLYCREYQTKAIIGGRIRQAYGTACRQPDGAWKLVN
jgi:surface antigen